MLSTTISGSSIAEKLVPQVLMEGPRDSGGDRRRIATAVQKYRLFGCVKEQ